MESSFQIHFCVLAEQSDHKVAVDLVEYNEEEDLIRQYLQHYYRYTLYYHLRIHIIS
jgi:hypothetical protein